MPDKENIMQDAVLYFTNANGEKMFLNAANFSINKAAEAFDKVGDKIYEASKSFMDFVHGFEFSATCKFPMGWRKTQLVMLGIQSKNDIRYVYRHAEKWRRYYKKVGITHVDKRMLFNKAVLDLLWRSMENHNERGKENG